AVMTIDRAAPTPGFVDAVVDPTLNALICATGAPHARDSQSGRQERMQLVRVAMFGGPDALSEAQKMRLIDDPDALAELHTEIWTCAEAHAGWRAALTTTSPVPEGVGNEIP